MGLFIGTRMGLVRYKSGSVGTRMGKSLDLSVQEWG